MSAIRNSISMQDRMTPVFRSIIKSMDSTLKMMERLDRQSNKGVQSKAFRQAEKDIKSANNALLKMQNQLAMVTREAGGLANNTERVSRSMNSMKSGGLNLVNLSAGLYLLQNIKAAISSIMSAPDEAKSTQARLGLFNESSNSKEQLYQEVYNIANRTRTDVGDTGNLATRILISGAMTGEGGAQGSLKVTEIINKALVAGGGTAIENRNALRQLSQSLASGQLQGDELRSIREQTPYLMKILAEGLGKTDPKFAGTTIGDMKRLGKEGELTSDRIVKAFFAMEKEVNESFAKMPRTFGQNMTVLGNIWKYWLYELSQGDNALAQLNNRLTEFTDFLASDLGTKVLGTIGNAINVVADGFFKFFDMGAAKLKELVTNTEALSYALTVLGAVAAAAAVIMAVAWAVANWPLTLTIMLIYIICKALYDAGVSSEQFAQVLGGAFGTVAAVIYNIFAWVYNTIVGLVEGIMNMFYDFGTGFEMFIMNIFDAIMEMVLVVADAIAGLLNMIPGVEIKNNLAATYHEESERLRKQNFKDAKVLDRMDYMDYDKASQIGSDMGTKLAGVTGKLVNTLGGLGDFDPSKMTLNGGTLDEVGKIGSDVDISDEDIKLLKDVAAREFLLNMATITPSASISFGDVHETADVNKIMDAIENMVEDALATYLVQ